MGTLLLSSGTKSPARAFPGVAVCMTSPHPACHSSLRGGRCYGGQSMTGAARTVNHEGGLPTARPAARRPAASSTVGTRCGTLPRMLSLLLLLLAQLGPVAVPGEASVWADPALRPAVEQLATLEAGRPLLAALVAGGVRVEVAALPNRDEYAAYERPPPVTTVAPGLLRLDPVWSPACSPTK